MLDKGEGILHPPAHDLIWGYISMIRLIRPDSGSDHANAQYKNRLKVPNKKTSAFFGKKSGDKWTQKAWKEGTPTADPNIKILRTNVSVGTGPNGGMQKQIRVVMDSKGKIHGSPWGPEH